MGADILRKGIFSKGKGLGIYPSPLRKMSAKGYGCSTTNRFVVSAPSVFVNVTE
jgi:hypothetical protein